MNTNKLSYIEESGLFFEKLGLTRMAGRALGYLMICDRDAVSFDEIREALDASKGSISGTAKMLVNTGLVDAVSLPGDRKTYYRVSRTRVGDMLRQRISMFEAYSELLLKGKSLKSRTDETSEWLDETARFYSRVSAELHKLIDHWESGAQPVKSDHSKKKKKKKSKK
ncbi:MAG: MarR family transcriptional regulator [Balneolales bacterium]|nr:MarR family transcriptional regulator [Balneolales bacterium]